MPERSNGWFSTLFFLLGPSPPTSTSDIIHVINAPKPSLFFIALPFSCINTERKPEQERPENEGKLGESYHVIWDTGVTHCLH